MKNDKGFTLVEIIIAITVGSLASLLVVMVLNLAFTQYRLSRTESQLEIEAQEMTEKLKPLLMCCDKIEQTNNPDGDNYIMVHSTDPNTGEMFYYYILIDNKKCYMFKCDTEVDISTLVISDSNYLAQYVDAIGFSPNNFDFEDDTSERDINCTVNLSSGDTTYNTGFIVRIRAY